MPVTANTRRVEGSITATLVLEVSDPANEVASVEFELVTVDPATGADVQRTGPYPPDVTRRPGWYEKDVLLNPVYRTRVEPVLRREDGSLIPAPAETFGLRTATVGGGGTTLKVQDADTPATDAAALVFQGAVARVENGVATLDLDSRYLRVNGAGKMAGPLVLNRETGAGKLAWYSAAALNWVDYLTPVGAAGPNGVATAGYADVSYWAVRHNAHNCAGCGWIWESGAADDTVNPATPMMALSSVSGNLAVRGSLRAGSGTFVTGSGAFLAVDNTAASFLTSVGGALQARVGSLLVSDSYSDAGAVPARGIWAKGNVVAYGGTLQLGASVKLYQYTDSTLWVETGAAASELVVATALNWDSAVRIHYAPGGAGAGGGVLSIGQFANKNAGTWTHGYTDLYAGGGRQVRVQAAAPLANQGATESMRLTAQVLQFGHPAATHETNSAQISAGRHQTDTLCIVGMSDAGGSSSTRRVKVWAEGGMEVVGPLTAVTAAPAFTAGGAHGSGGLRLGYHTLSSSSNGWLYLGNESWSIYGGRGIAMDMLWVSAGGSTFNSNAYFQNGASLHLGGHSGFGDPNTIYSPNWFRSTGATGWYSQSYGVGLYSDRGGYLRTLGSAGLLLGASGLLHEGAVGTDQTFGLYFDSGRSPDYAVFREAGGWGFPYPDLRIAFHTGIKLGAHFSYGGVRFYSNSDMATELMSVGNGDLNVRVQNSLYVGQAISAAGGTLGGNPIATVRAVPAGSALPGGTIQGTLVVVY